MEIITKEYKVYKFEELSKDVRQKVIEKFAQHELETDWWDMTLESIHEDLSEKYGISCKDIYFDLYGGRYVKLADASIDDMKKFLISAGAEKWMIAQELDSNDNKGWDINRVDISINDSRREIENTLDVNESGFYNEEKYPGHLTISEDCEQDLEKEMGIDLNQHLQNILEEVLEIIIKEQEYVGSEENIKSIIEMNEYTFLENGEVFN